MVKSLDCWKRTAKTVQMMPKVKTPQAKTPLQQAAAFLFTGTTHMIVSSQLQI